MGHGLSPRTVVGEGKESTNARTLKPKFASAVLQLGGGYGGGVVKFCNEYKS
jgi:hypothetical protein